MGDSNLPMGLWPQTPPFPDCFRQRNLGHLWTQSHLVESRPVRQNTVLPFAALGSSAEETLGPHGPEFGPGPSLPGKHP